MREIKFRGKDIENDNTWRYGSLITYPSACTSIIGFDKLGNELNHDVDPDTVGQFTGLKDKSGKEIYEGDIISVNGKYPKLIRYIDEWASYCLANLTDLDCDLKTRYWQQVSPCWWTDYKREIKVIGNVYDNPELLKGGNDGSDI